MFTLEVPLEDIEAVVVDSAYERRAVLSRQAPSLPVTFLGKIIDRETFSGAFAAPGRFGEYWERGKDRRDENIRFRKDADVVEYSFPERLRQFSEALAVIAAFEHTAYPDATYEDIAVSAEQSVVKAGEAQRTVNKRHLAHRDCGSGIWAHCYLVSDASPTQFFPGIRGGRSLKLETVAVNGDDVSRAVAAEPYEIVFANRTTFHRSPPVEETITRTFLRVIYQHALSAAEAV